MYIKPEQIERFWSSVVKNKDGCWEWQGRKNRGGYGEFNVKVAGVKRLYRAHRVAYYITHGDPGILHVLHNCDNRQCVRPDHLYLGTNTHNVRDRNIRGKTHRRISWDTVNEMRRLFSEGEMKIRDIDKLFNYVGCNAILRNNLWYDSNYHPPKKHRGPRPNIVEIYKETKTLKEWSLDGRCQVSIKTLRARYKQGIRGQTLLAKYTNRGRPRDIDAHNTVN